MSNNPVLSTRDRAQLFAQLAKYAWNTTPQSTKNKVLTGVVGTTALAAGAATGAAAAAVGRRKRKSQPQSRPGQSLVSVATVPAAKSYKPPPFRPKVTMANGVTRISGREEVASIYGSVGFSTTQFTLNPGLNTFTWLKNQVLGWEKYKYVSLQAVYIPSQATTTTAGTVYMAYDYDPEDAPPDSAAELSTFETTCSGRVYESSVLSLNTGRAFSGVQHKKVRTGPVPSGLTLYDPATLTIATEDCKDDTPIGKLWLYYDLILTSQQTAPSKPICHTASSVYILLDAVTTAYDTWINCLSVPTVQPPDKIDALQLATYVDGSNLTLPLGTYRITWTYRIHANVRGISDVHTQIYKSPNSVVEGQHHQSFDTSSTKSSSHQVSCIVYGDGVSSIQFQLKIVTGSEAATATMNTQYLLVELLN